MPGMSVVWSDVPKTDNEVFHVPFSVNSIREKQLFLPISENTKEEPVAGSL
jgi:hypothetical protein